MKTTKDFWKIMSWAVVLTALLIFPGCVIFFVGYLASKVFGDILMFPEIFILIIKMLITFLILLPSYTWFWEPMLQKIEKKIKEAQANEVLVLS